MFCNLLMVDISFTYENNFAEKNEHENDDSVLNGEWHNEEISGFSKYELESSDGMTPEFRPSTTLYCRYWYEY